MRNSRCLEIGISTACTMASVQLALHSLKLVELRTLAAACGLPSSGTKTALAARLDASISEYRSRLGAANPTARSSHILSIDMGIRNLAFSSLTPPLPCPAGTSPGINTPLVGVTVDTWSRCELVPSQKSQVLKQEEDIWSPANMADKALSLVQDRLLSLGKPPTHILIERQRFRSGGGAAVQEWTLRVNTLEAMIYSTLKTLKACGRWTGEIISIPPRIVGPFWLHGTQAENSTASNQDPELETRKNAKARHKKEKIDLVAKWLKEGRMNMTVKADLTARAYLDRWEGKRSKKLPLGDIGNTIEPLPKLDDLADSLLQGLAWIKWQENKERMARDGPAALLQAPST